MKKPKKLNNKISKALPEPQQEMLSRKFKKLKHKISYLNMENEEVSEVFKHAKEVFISEMLKYCSSKNIMHPFENASRDPTKKDSIDNEQIKDLYREIVKKTHPDKTLELTEEESRSRSDLYHEASEGKSSGDLNAILKVALELDIEIDGINSELLEVIEGEILILESKISKAKSDIMYRWYYEDSVAQESIFAQLTKNENNLMHTF